MIQRTLYIAEMWLWTTADYDRSNGFLGYAWMKTHLPSTAVVASEWSYGTELNVLAGVRTVTGPDHYIPYWIELYHRHVEHAKNEYELMTFLFSHDVTHLLVTEKQPAGTLLRSGSLSEAFQPRYPESGFETASVKLYEMLYPPESEKRSEYLLRNPRVEGTSDWGK